MKKGMAEGCVLLITKSDDFEGSLDYTLSIPTAAILVFLTPVEVR